MVHGRLGSLVEKNRPCNAFNSRAGRGSKEGTTQPVTIEFAASYVLKIHPPLEIESTNAPSLVSLTKRPPWRVRIELLSPRAFRAGPKGRSDTRPIAV
jgi:hypothetical protein